MKKHVMTALRVLLVLAGVGYVLWSITWTDQVGPLVPGGEPVVVQEGMLTLVKNASPSHFVVGLVMMGLTFPVLAARWWMLLRCRGLDVSYRSVLRLVMVGIFFNFCVPLGANGGDLARAYGAAKGIKTPGSKTLAVVSVFIDRATGLTALVILAAVMGPYLGDTPMGRHITWLSWAVLGGMVLAVAFYLAPFTRRLPGIKLLKRLNTLKVIDQSFRGYRSHPWTVLGSVLASVPIHLLLVSATAMAGWALGAPTPVVLMFAVLPIVFLMGSLPITFMGMGVMEAVAFPMLVGDGGATKNQVVGMLNAFRGFMFIYALVGAVILLSSGMHLREQLAAVNDLAEDGNLGV